MQEKNARFWVYLNGAPVKLTLAPGQTRSWSRWAETEEGWSSTSEQWSFDGTRVTRIAIDDGRDCDGRLTRSRTLEATLADLYTGAHRDGVAYPSWSQLNARIHDEYAVAAGY